MAITPDEYRRFFEYEKDSHAKVLHLLVLPLSVPLPEFQAVDLMAHMTAARWLWLFRFGVAAEPPTDLFSREVSLDPVPELLRQMETASELARRFEYQSLEGPQ